MTEPILKKLQLNRYKFNKNKDCLSLFIYLEIRCAPLERKSPFIFMRSYFSIALYFTLSAKSPAGITSHFRSQATGIPAASRSDIYPSRSGKVRSRVGNFLRSGRFAKSRELPAERRKLEERRNMYRPRASSLSFTLSPRQTREASRLPLSYS